MRCHSVMLAEHSWAETSMNWPCPDCARQASAPSTAMAA